MHDLVCSAHQVRQVQYANATPLFYRYVLVDCHACLNTMRMAGVIDPLRLGVLKGGFHVHNIFQGSVGAKWLHNRHSMLAAVSTGHVAPLCSEANERVALSTFAREPAPAPDHCRLLPWVNSTPLLAGRLQVQE